MKVIVAMKKKKIKEMNMVKFNGDNENDEDVNNKVYKYNNNDGIEYESEDDGIEYYMY